MDTDLRELVTTLLDALPQAALLVGREGRVFLRNSAARQILPPGDAVEQLLHESTGREIHWATELTALGESAGSVVRRNISLSACGGRRLLVDIHLRSVGPEIARFLASGEDGRDGQCVLVLVEDVSGRVSAARRLAAEERLAAAGPLAAQVAHELNNPLDGVLRFVGLAERLVEAPATDYLAQARDGLMRMARIIRGLLEQGRPWQVAGERAEVQAILEEAVGAMQPRAETAGVSVICDIGEGIEGAVEGSVFQVFCNVIKNALDAMPGGGVLTITVRAESGRCVVRFDDTGCGLTREESERIFEPFHSTKPPGEGSGLGLSISREILARIGGTIAAAPRDGGGARITVTFPLHPTWKPSRQEAEP